MLQFFRVSKFGSTSAFQHRALTSAFAASLVGLAFAPAGLAQSGSASPSAPDRALYVNIVQGEDALNNIHSRTTQQPIVLVTDAHEKPLSGVSVLFSEISGESGAGAAFGAEQTYKTATDASGKAMARGFHPNQTLGKYTVKVDATTGAILGATTIHETNVEKDAIAVAGAGGAMSGAIAAGTLPSVVAAGSVATGAVVGVLESFGTAAAPALAVPLGSPAVPASVPEIDLSMAFGGLMLLAGSAAVLRGR